MDQLKKIFLKDRYSVLVATIIIYMTVLMVEGLLTGREARVIDLENPYFDFDVRDWERFRQSRDDSGSTSPDSA